MAAKALTGVSSRGCASRLYALFADLYARLIESKEQPWSQRGTWSHERLAKIVMSKLGLPQLARVVREARLLRETADYAPGRSVTKPQLIKLLARVDQEIGYG